MLWGYAMVIQIQRHRDAEEMVVLAVVIVAVVLIAAVREKSTKYMDSVYMCTFLPSSFLLDRLVSFQVSVTQCHSPSAESCKEE